MADLRSQLGLDKPLTEQFVDYVVGLARFDLGRSLAVRTPVTNLLGQALLPTLLLTLGGTLVSVVVGVPLGVLAALKRRTWLDYVASIGALLGISIPIFVWGVARVAVPPQVNVVASGIFLVAIALGLANVFWQYRSAKKTRGGPA